MGTDDTEGNWKASARCRYHHLCSLYNNSVLEDSIEISMCGKDNPAETEFEPTIPEVPDSDFKPTKNYAHGPGGICDAFLHFYDSEVLGNLESNISKLGSIFDNHKYW